MITCDDDDDDDELFFFPHFILTSLVSLVLQHLPQQSTQPLLETHSASHPKVRSQFEQQKVLKTQCVSRKGSLH